VRQLQVARDDLDPRRSRRVDDPIELSILRREIAWARDEQVALRCLREEPRRWNPRDDAHAESGRDLDRVLSVDVERDLAAGGSRVVIERRVVAACGEAQDNGDWS
jgi:hypothetical protein